MIVVLVGLELAEVTSTNRTRVLLDSTLFILGLQCRVVNLAKAFVLRNLAFGQLTRFPHQKPHFRK